MTLCMDFIKHSFLKADIFFNPNVYSIQNFYKIPILQKSPGFSESTFFWVQVFKVAGPGFEVAYFTIYEKFWSNCSFIPLRFWSARIVVVIAKTEASNKQQEMAYTFFSLKKIDNL